MQVYQAIASKIEAMRNCERNGNGEWFAKHENAINDIVSEYMPSGSGFNAGTAFYAIDHVNEKADKLVFMTGFHHMNEYGMYDGWTYHKVVVRPSLAHGFTLRVTGSNRNRIKEYIADTFHAALSALWSN